MTAGDAEMAALFGRIRQLPVGPQLECWVIYNRVYPSGVGVTENAFLLQLVPNQHFSVIHRYQERYFLQDPVLLAAAFRMTEVEGDAGRTIIISWGHGSVFGLFRDEGAKGILTNEGLGEALARGLQRPAELVILMNCGMQNIYTCFSLRAVCQVLVAPMGTIRWPGYPFEAMAAWLTADPGMSARELGRRLTAAIHELPVTGWQQEWAVFAADLQQLGPCLELLNGLADTLIHLLQTEGKRYYRILSDMPGSLRYHDTENYMTDLRKFLSILVRNDPERFGSWPDRLEQLLQALFLPDPYIGEGYRHKKPSPSGLGVLYPQDFDKFFVLDDAVYPVFFDRHSQYYLRINEVCGWLDFLRCYQAIRQG
ncbi:MAG: hypothetical protein P0Y53_03815 [Candidatus Pseudobacter hemicellulosilyticus]|uniref:Uncharacterized protein n=1 Tax=Candidatus Pseudobacter hemicellulosilyticus TaxID=3121375 RepID=A0AAJ6BGY7_9BACT|nr:MAG: hypothetical protein P0Y53_03815 [Pseudobacter sp.]